jgi:hypothetical protein
MAKKKSSALARLVTSIEIKNPDGSLTLVPVSAEDNTTANKILASQMRDLISRSIAKFGSLDMMTPKELKEITEAARNIAEFSGEVYKSGDFPQDGDSGEKHVDQSSVEPIDFASIKSGQKKPEEQEGQLESTPPPKEKGAGF